MTNGRIPDYALTASSMLDSQHGPQYGRLYMTRRDGYDISWYSSRNVVGEWLKVDLGTVVIVTKIATQGRRSDVDGEYVWVEQYTLEFSDNGTDFQQYGNNKVKIHPTITNTTSIATVAIAIATAAKEIRTYTLVKPKQLVLGCEMVSEFRMWYLLKVPSSKTQDVMGREKEKAKKKRTGMGGKEKRKKHCDILLYKDCCIGYMKN